MKFVYDLKDPATSWSGSSKSYFSTGDISSEAGNVIEAEGPHRLYWMLDTVMYKVPESIDIDTVHMAHYHKRGYETFFVDSGSLWLFINNQKVLVKKGDIVHLQAGQSHGMYFLEDVKWRGTYHDYDVPSEMMDVAIVMANMPEAANDPELKALDPGMDHIKMEPLLYTEVPAEQCLAVKNPDRPWAEYKFDGVTMKVIVERWENGGTKELCCAVMQPGFTAEWDKYPAVRDEFYIRKGKVKFTIMGQEVIADDECVVNIPKFAPHSMEVLEETEMYELGGQTMWSLFLQQYTSLKLRYPERFNDPAEIEALKKKCAVTVKSIGMK